MKSHVRPASAAAAAAVLLSLAAIQAPGDGDQMVWTLDEKGNPSSRVILRESGEDEWQPVLWTSYHANGKKRSEGVKGEGAATWKYWDVEGKAVDRGKQIRALRKGIEELMAKPELDVAEVEVQHILIAFNGAPRMTNVTRSKEEAEELAAEVYAQLMAGGDMDALVKAHTNDSAPGIYPMTAQSRRSMVAGFGDVGWRLEVGKIGVAPHDPQKSPFGWHIIKRLK